MLKTTTPPQGCNPSFTINVAASKEIVARVRPQLARCRIGVSIAPWMPPQAAQIGWVFYNIGGCKGTSLRVVYRKALGQGGIGNMRAHKGNTITKLEDMATS